MQCSGVFGRTAWSPVVLVRGNSFRGTKKCLGVGQATSQERLSASFLAGVQSRIRTTVQVLLSCMWIRIRSGADRLSLLWIICSRSMACCKLSGSLSNNITSTHAGPEHFLQSSMVSTLVWNPLNQVYKVIQQTGDWNLSHNSIVALSGHPFPGFLIPQLRKLNESLCGSLMNIHQKIIEG